MALKTLQVTFIVSIHDIPLWFLCSTCTMFFPGCPKSGLWKLADVMFFMAWTGKDHPQMLNISATVPIGKKSQEDVTICHCSPKAFGWYYGKKYEWHSATFHTTKANAQWGLFLEISAEVTVSQVRQMQDRRSRNDDLGNRDLFRRRYRDKGMSEDDDPSLLIRGRSAQRKGLLPPPLLRPGWGFQICVGSWRSDGTCILSGWRRGYRNVSFGFVH